ncbi:TonB-dependent receptor [Agaribacterium haliotis]|uniref:TonB-dependent receptor n=1 Tax=Agaribacterium haliotis TaxID=2013869 RepID=UPI000BB54E30|nr:TonB-dependent receptor [Agaribacterium haliotis]
MINQNPRRGAHCAPVFHKKALAVSIATCLSLSASAAVFAQEGNNLEEEVFVLGHRGAQATAINIKRESAVVMDSLSAENIGKLPDVTIADSLQRIPGIQIRRSAGEGTEVSLRGLPQVVTKLNDEAFMGAGSIVTVQPSFSDLPAQLFKGADVYKSSSANQAIAGITGTIDLKTWRPFDFEQGLSATASAEVQRGNETEDIDPAASGLLSWRNDRIGVMASAAYSNPHLSNSYNGVNTAEPGDSGWTNASNAWGDQSSEHHWAAPQGFVGWNQETERERYGFNGALQAELGGGFEIIAEAFYSEEEEYNRKIGMSATNKWQGLDYFTPTKYKDKGVYIKDYDAESNDDRRTWITWQEIDVDARRVKSFSQNDSFNKDSTNLNLQLNYDNGGMFTGSARYLHGEANLEKRHGYNEGDLTDGSATGINPFYPAEYCGDNGTVAGVDGGCFVPPNPRGYTEIPQITYNTEGKHARFSGFDQEINGGLGPGHTLRDYMANIDSYNVGAFSSENNENSSATLDVFRLDGSLKFENSFFTSVDAGLRYSDRSIDQEKYHLFSPFYDEGCLVQWKATDVVLNAEPEDPDLRCVAGENLSSTGEFQGYTALPPIPINLHNNVKWVTDFGPVKGIPGIWAVDPADYDNPESFHNKVFGSTVKAVVPGDSYKIDYSEQTIYVQANFELGLMSGNIGVRQIETEMKVHQNETGEDRPYGNTPVDIGDITTEVEHSFTLPALNLNFAITDDFFIRAAYTENMTPLDLDNWGGGENYERSLNADDGQWYVNKASKGGNPQLKPWQSTNYDLSAEWYLGQASSASIAAFLVDIDSFVQQTEVPTEFPGPNGSTVTIGVDTPVQGDGGQIHGLELAGRLAFSDLSDGWLNPFGLDANYTWSPSEQDDEDIEGKQKPFPENSEHQLNLIAWFEQGPWQARIAYNYRSERLAEENRATDNLDVYQKPVGYVDLSASYAFSEQHEIYFNGSNVTGSYEEYYFQWDDQYAYQNYYEPRYTLGYRFKL